MKSKFLLLLSLSAITYVAKAQEAAKTVDPPLTITGSVDTYFKYDFSGHNNIPTSFATDQASFSIGMVDLGLKKKVGKASFVGEVSFGPRSDQSIPVATNHIQNLYVGYDLTDKLNVTAGYMATFVGYEVIAPSGNFNYSTSYLFTNGPFQNAGVKLTYAFSDKVSLMAGLFNDYWNVYTSAGKINTFGAQLMVAPAKGWTAYINLATGPVSGTEVDLTTAYQITDMFKLGLNVADFSAPTAVKGGFTGVALYPQVAVSPAVTLGLRGEYFKTKVGGLVTAGPAAGDSVTGLTFTANIKGGPLTFIPEVRLDNGSKTMFTDNKGVATKSASQFALAAVYAF
ncbi:MAG: porin [Bacteroidota bacterium]